MHTVNCTVFVLIVLSYLSEALTTSAKMPKSSSALSEEEKQLLLDQERVAKQESDAKRAEMARKFLQVRLLSAARLASPSQGFDFRKSWNRRKGTHAYLFKN